MENDPKFWRTVADRLEDYSIGDCQLQYAWNEYCKDNDAYEQQILINDRTGSLTPLWDCRSRIYTGGLLRKIMI